MKYTVLTILAVLSLSVGNALAQTAVRYSFDTDIRQIRMNDAGQFHYTYDDYLQYSPAVVMVGLKAFGYKGRSSWGRMLVSDAFSAAVMFGAVNGIKYSVKRMRPDGTSRNSFPSGHTATAFLTATMLHKEYGWRSPWFSIGGYAAATVTGVSRILNDRHWMSDVAAGAVIGVSAVHLGYFLSDLIFEDRQLYDGYEKPEFHYDADARHYNAELYFGRRFLLGEFGKTYRSSIAGLATDIPIVPRWGIRAAAAVGSISEKTDVLMTLPSTSIDSFNQYCILCGPSFNYPFAKYFECGARLMAGYGWNKRSGNADILAGAYFALITGNSFKIKAFADYETFRPMRQKPFAHAVIIGYAAAFSW